MIFVPFKSQAKAEEDDMSELRAVRSQRESDSAIGWKVIWSRRLRPQAENRIHLRRPEFRRCTEFLYFALDFVLQQLLSFFSLNVQQKSIKSIINSSILIELGRFFYLLLLLLDHIGFLWSWCHSKNLHFKKRHKLTIKSIKIY